MVVNLRPAKAIATDVSDPAWMTLGAAALSVLFVGILCRIFQPLWNTNDDIGMSMIAHGYGTAVEASPNIVFSNLLWGHLVRLVPMIAGVPGYTVLTLLVLVVSGAALGWAVLRLGLGWAGAVLVLVALLTRPVLFPQFTINAGLLTVAAVLCWHFAGREGARRPLLTGCVLAFCGYLVRFEEFALIVLAALPLLPWASLRRDRMVQGAAVALALAVAGAAFLDQRAYQTPDWAAFNALDPVRTAFTDFGADRYLTQMPDLLARHGYSVNDINLIRHWFFLDPSFANPAALGAMLTELGPIVSQSNSIADGRAGLSAFLHPDVLPLTMMALILFVLRPGWKVAAVWALCLGAGFGMGLVGRPGTMRVYIPMVALLVVAPLLQRGQDWAGPRWGLWPLYTTFLAAGWWNASTVIPESRFLEKRSAELRDGMRDFPTEPVLAWGSSFPFEAAYPLLQDQGTGPAPQLYELGVFTIAPFSRVVFDARRGDGPLERLTKPGGLAVIANALRFGLLATYCDEHLAGSIDILAIRSFGPVEVRWLRCDRRTGPG